MSRTDSKRSQAIKKKNSLRTWDLHGKTLKTIYVRGHIRFGIVSHLGLKLDLSTEYREGSIKDEGGEVSVNEKKKKKRWYRIKTDKMLKCVNSSISYIKTHALRRK